METWLPYLAVLGVTIFLNTADIYFLQPSRTPRLQAAPSYWLYMIGHALVGLGAAYLLYEKSGLTPEEWPIVTMVAALTGFSLLQSWTLKFGQNGIDARELFDAWKRRVIEDVAQSNTSRTRTLQLKAARELVKEEKKSPGLLDSAVHQLAPTVGQDAQNLLASFKTSGAGADLRKAQWIALVDLEFAENLCELSG